MDPKNTTTTTVTRTVRVNIPEERVREILRKECGAPADAYVELNDYDDTTVTWSTTETN